uniref:formyl peptide receptor-related sequence 6-like n=1 Tax=Pristiophorus japonicus TaxID=55135 RepID=UPI00398E8A4E
MPGDLREAITVTIFKKGDKSDCGNYRGISLLSTTGKGEPGQADLRSPQASTKESDLKVAQKYRGRHCRLLKMSSTLPLDADYLLTLFPYTAYSPDELNDDEEVPVFLLLISCTICLLGILGSALVLCVAGHEVKKTASMIWLLNLSLADFTFTALLPFSITHMALRNHWPFGRFMCKFLGFTNNLNTFVSVLILAVISLDRCVSVTLPVWSQNHRTVKSAVAVSLVAWTMAAVASVPFSLMRETTEDEYMGKTYCFYDEDAYRLSCFVVTRFVLAFLIPFVTIAACYSIIAVKVRRRWKKNSRKSCRIISMIMLAFFICWLPFHVLNIIHATTDEHFGTWLPLATQLAYANSCINPLLYLFAGRGGSCFHVKKRIRMALKAFHKEMSNSGSRV